MIIRVVGLEQPVPYAVLSRFITGFGLNLDSTPLSIGLYSAVELAET